MDDQLIELDKKKFWVYFAIIALVTVINYFPFINLPFYPDDFNFVAYGHQVASNPSKLLTLRTSERDLRIFPVLCLSIVYHFFNNEPIAYHLVNLILHIISLLLWMYVLYLVSNDINLTFFSSLLFSVYFPIGVVVIFLTCIIELCFMIFGLLSFLFYIKYSNSKNHVYYLLSILFFICSVFSKETGMVFVGVFFLYRCLIKPFASKKSFIIESLKFIPYFIGIFTISYLTFLYDVKAAVLDFDFFWTKLLRLYSYLFLIIPTFQQIKSFFGLSVSISEHSNSLILHEIVYLSFIALVILSMYILVRSRNYPSAKMILFFLICSIIPLIPVSSSMYIMKNFANMTGFSWYVYIPAMFFTTLVYIILRDVILKILLPTPGWIKISILILPVLLNLYLYKSYGKNVAYAVDKSWTNVFDSINSQFDKIGDGTKFFTFGKMARYMPSYIRAMCQKEIETEMVLPNNDPRFKRLKPLMKFMKDDDPRLDKIESIKTVIDYDRFLKKLLKSKSYRIFYIFDNSVLNLTSAFENKELMKSKKLFLFGLNLKETEKKFLTMINGKDNLKPDFEFWLSRFDPESGKVIAEVTLKNLADLDENILNNLYSSSENSRDYYFMVLYKNEGFLSVPDAIINSFLDREMNFDVRDKVDNHVILFNYDGRWKIIVQGSVDDFDPIFYHYF